MKPVPMTAAPIVGDAGHARPAPRSLTARLSRPSRWMRRWYGGLLRAGQRRDVTVRTSARHHRTLACQVQKWSDRAPECARIDRGWSRPAIRAGRTRPRAGPLPDEALDALVTVLDEIRLGRSRSRSELVERTGLGRAIVAQPRRRADRPRAGRRGRRRAEHRRPPAAPAGVPRRRPGTSSSPTSARRASTSRSRPSTAGSSATTTSRPGSRPARSRCLDRVDALFDVAAAHDQGRARAGCGASGSACRARSSSRPAARSRRRSCRAGTATRSASGSPPATAPRSGSTTTSTCWPSGEWRSGRRRRATTTSSSSRSGPGIGAGIISDGRLHRGAQGSAGDVGHIQVVGRPVGRLPLRQHRLPRGAAPAARRSGAPVRRPRATAAARGCALALDQRGTVTAEDVARAASFGDPVAVALLQSAGRRVGSMLASVVNFFNPSLIVIGGGVANSPDQFLAVDPRDGLPPLAAAGDARAAHRSARRSAGWPASSARRRWSWTSCSRASRSAAGSRPATRPLRPAWTWRRGPASPSGPPRTARRVRRSQRRADRRDYGDQVDASVPGPHTRCDREPIRLAC